MSYARYPTDEFHTVPLRGTLVRAFVSGDPNNAFCKLKRGELTLSQVQLTQKYFTCEHGAGDGSAGATAVGQPNSCHFSLPKVLSRV